MSVRLAKTAGFCFGVNRAVEMALAAAENRDQVYMLGQLIHNRAVTDKLVSLGVQEVQSLAEVPEGAAVIVRAHGVPKSVYDEIAARKLELIDVTCPFVRKIHRIVEQESAANRRVIIMGDPIHPEVIGIGGWCMDAIVCQDASDLENLSQESTDFASCT